MTIRPTLFRAVLPILALVAVLVGCSGGQEYASLPDGVSAVVAWNELRERWHIGVIGDGDRDGSILRVLCITDAAVSSDFDQDRLLPGLNIDVSLAEGEGGGSLKGVWKIDGRSWDGEDWVREQGHSPPAFVASSAENAQSLYDALRDAGTASFTSLASIDDSPLITTTFDVGALFSTPVQSTLDECKPDGLDKRFSSELATVYAYWHQELQRHWFSMVLPELSGQGRVALVCSPIAFYDQTPSWLSAHRDDHVALIASILPSDQSHLAGDATVQWSSEVVGREATRWEMVGRSLVPGSHQANLKFYDALRRSPLLDLVVRTEDADPLYFQVAGADALSAPLTGVMHGCVQEYADGYEQ